MKVLVLLGLLLVSTLATVPPLNADGTCGGAGGKTDYYYSSGLRCIDDTCNVEMDKLATYLDGTTGITIADHSVGGDERQEVTIAQTVLACGAGNAEECIPAGCIAYQVQIYNNDNTPQYEDLQGAKDFSETLTFTIGDSGDYSYTNGTHFTASSNTYTGKIKINYYFNGADSSSTSIIASREFDIVLTEKQGADTVNGEMGTATTIALKSVDVTPGLSANIRDTPQDITGVLTLRAGASPFTIGDNVQLNLANDAGNTRDFDLGSLVVELTFNTGANKIALTPNNPVKQGTPGTDVMSIDFDIDVNVIGTYTISAKYTLVPVAARRLIEEDITLEQNLGQITIDVQNVSTNNNVQYLLVAIFSAVTCLGLYLTQLNKKQLAFKQLQEKIIVTALN